MIRKLSSIAAICCLLPLSSFAKNPQIIVGDYTTNKNQYMPLIAVNQTENNWTYPTLQPLPSDTLNVNMSGAGCSSKFCAAVGSYHNKEYHPLIAVSFDKGNQWTYLSKLSDNLIPSALSCNNNLCVAVGVDQSKGNHPYMPFVAVGHGSDWNVPSSVISNLPSDLIEGDFSKVTCNDSFCVAAGEYDSKDGRVYPMVAVSEDKDKAHWTYSSLASLFPKDMHLADVFGLNCTDKVCIITGLYRLESEKQVAYLATSYDKGKTWAFPKDITSNLPESDDTRLDKVDCQKENCIAVGSYHPNNNRSIINYTPLIAVSHNSGKTWVYVKDLVSKLPTDYASADFWNVGCNEKICLAGGQLSLKQRGGKPFLMYSKDHGDTWSMLNEFPKDYVDGGGSFTGGINCNETSCFAVGTYRNAERYIPLVVTTQDANSWSYPSSIIDNLPQDFLYGVNFYTDSSSKGLMAKRKH